MLRKELDKLDYQLLNIFKKRTQLVKKVLLLKKYKNEIVDMKRISTTLSKVKKESMIKIERYIEDQKKYQKNTHQLSDNIKKRLMKQWRFAFDHWNYTYPDN